MLERQNSHILEELRPSHQLGQLRVNGLAPSFTVIFLRLMLRRLLVMGLLNFWDGILGLFVYLLLFLRSVSPTSYSAIFRENMLGNTPEGFTQQATNAIYQDYDMLAKPATYESYNREEQEYIVQGIRVLQRLPDKATCERLIEIHFDVADAMIPERVVHYCNERIWSTYGDVLSRPRSSDKLSVMSRELCKNAMSPLAPAASTQE